MRSPVIPFATAINSLIDIIVYIDDVFIPIDV